MVLDLAWRLGDKWPTCDAFCVKVTMAITLVHSAFRVFVPACCSVIFCVVWACTELICAVLC